MPFCSCTWVNHTSITLTIKGIKRYELKWFEGKQKKDEKEEETNYIFRFHFLFYLSFDLSFVPSAFEEIGASVNGAVCTEQKTMLLTSNVVCMLAPSKTKKKQQRHEKRSLLLFLYFLLLFFNEYESKRMMEPKRNEKTKKIK